MNKRYKKEATIESDSYMEMGLHTDGEESLILRIPTFWDAIENRWIGAVKTPITRKIISASGKDSMELQNNFNIEFSKWMHDEEFSKEIFAMFKPLSYWENNNGE